LSTTSKATVAMHGLLFLVLCLVLAVSGANKGPSASEAPFVAQWTFPEGRLEEDVRSNRLSVAPSPPSVFPGGGITLRALEAPGTVDFPLEEAPCASSELVVVWACACPVPGVFPEIRLASKSHAPAVPLSSPASPLPREDRIPWERLCPLETATVRGEDPGERIQLHVPANTSLHLKSVTLRSSAAEEGP